MRTSRYSGDAMRFLSTPSGWRATVKSSTASKLRSHFYPRPPGGGRLKLISPKCTMAKFLSTPSFGISKAPRFLSTPSGWRATQELTDYKVDARFLSTPSGWRATKDDLGYRGAWPISIHALRVEGDRRGRVLRSRQGISIHALRVEGDLKTPGAQRTRTNFYPRPPGGGRPATVPPARLLPLDFYPRPPGGGRPLLLYLCSQNAEIISIHALRVEGDSPALSLLLYSRPFLSTSSGWRATFILIQKLRYYFISIHALRVEGDT